MSEDWIPEEHPVPRPHMEECGSFPDGCCPWMPEPCDCQCTCDDLISAYERGRRDAINELLHPKCLSKEFSPEFINWVKKTLRDKGII